VAADRGAVVVAVAAAAGAERRSRDQLDMLVPGRLCGGLEQILCIGEDRLYIRDLPIACHAGLGCFFIRLLPPSVERMGAPSRNGEP
jgi:hypothetical protein